MEKRVLLLVILCIAVFLGWSLLMQAIYPPVPVKPQAPPTPASGPNPAIAPAPPTPQSPRQAEETEKIGTLKNGRLKVTVTNRGAGILEGTLTVEGQRDPMLLLKAFDPKVPCLAIDAEGGPDDIARGLWSVQEEIPDRSITYVYRMRNGVDIEKKLTLEPEGQEVGMLLTIRSSTPAAPADLRLRLIALTGLDHDSQYRYDYYGLGFVTTVSAGAHSTTAVAYDAPLPRPRHEFDRDPPRWHTFEIPTVEAETREVEWFGLRNRYATAVLLAREDRRWIRRVDFRATTQTVPQKTPPRDELQAEGILKSIREFGHPGPEVPRPLKALTAEAVLREIRVADQPHIAKFSLVLSPIRAQELKAIPGATEYLLSYGCWGLFNPIGKLILLVLGQVYSIVGNYGWAIILTTFLVRLLMFPLTRKSQVSMSRMAELQPKLNLLREKYGDDNQKIQQETMKLFREEKVSPLSGCFPILLTLPIFVGLYSVLDISLEFRHAPFIGWIRDLSQPDRLIAFGTPVNLWITSIGEFNLVPLIMTITWFLQSYYAPKPQDPRMAAQQKMMMFMPVMFGLLCYSLASGLSLYLFVNSLMAMVEQKVIKRYFIPRKALSGPPGLPGKA